jgi:flagellar protein FliL
VSKAPKPKAPALDPADLDAAATAGAEDAARARKKKMILIGAATAVVLLGGGGTAFALMSGGEEAAPAEAEAPAADDQAEAGAEGEAEAKAPTFIEAPEMIVNLRSADGSPRFLKLRIMLVPTNPAAEAHITERLPLILDSFQPYLRELRPQDLSGSAAVFRIKEELRLRASDAVGPGKVKDILIQDMIQQ